MLFGNGRRGSSAVTARNRLPHDTSTTSPEAATKSAVMRVRVLASVGNRDQRPRNCFMSGSAML